MKKLIKNRIVIIILIYTIVGIILPFGFKYIIFENTALSHLTNNEWAGFLGSYVGGILGGLGTLISVYITVKDSRDMQAENKKDTDKQISDNRKERDIERKEDRKLMEQRERKEFADKIADYIGKYITYISKYYYASLSAERIDKNLDGLCDDLKKMKNKLSEVERKIEKAYSNSDEPTQLRMEKKKLLDNQQITKRTYKKQLKEKERNSIEGDRTQANECYFILNTKLFNIAQANDMLRQLDVLHKEMPGDMCGENKNWLKKNTDALVTEYYKFKIEFEMESSENIPLIFF